MQLTFPPPPHAERRRSQRWDLPPGCASASLRRPGERDFGPGGSVCDVSWGGVRVEVDQPPDAGETVEVKVTLSGDHGGLLRATGRVVRFLGETEPGPARIAIAFTHIDDPANADQLTRR